MLFELLKFDFATSNILYIGYGNSDPNWSLVLSEILICGFGLDPNYLLPIALLQD